MMLKCTKEISPEEVEALQAWKNTPMELDYTTHEQLIKIDWELLRFQGEADDPMATRPVEMSAEESMMSNEVEELSEEMRRESDLENRKSLGKTSLAFIDLEGMSASLQLVFIFVAIALFGTLGYFFYTNLFVEKEDHLKSKRAKLNAKRDSKKDQ